MEKLKVVLLYVVVVENVLFEYVLLYVLKGYEGY